MVQVRKLFSLFFGAAALIAALLSAPAPAASQSVPATPPEASSRQLTNFDARYQAVMQTAETGKLSADVKNRIFNLRVSLQHALVDADADIERLKDRIRGAGSDHLETLLNRLVAAGAHRQALVEEALRRLNLLAAGTAVPATPIDSRDSARPSPARQAESSQAGQITIEFQPEDLTHTPME